MQKYNTLNFKKSSIICIKDQNPKKSFYIITKGKAISYRTFNFNVEFNKGDIIGLVNSLLNEPYFFNIKALEDVEVIEVETNDIINTNNKELMVKIADNLDSSFEKWLGRYYLLLSDDKAISYGKTKEEVFNMIKVYNKNGLSGVSHKLCHEYINFFPESEEIDEVKNYLSGLTAIEEPTKTEDNIYHYKKGYCLYTELVSSERIYIIKSVKVGIYNVVNLQQITRSIYSKNHIIDGYKPILSYQPLSTYAVILEDSVIKVLTKEELMNMLKNDHTVELYYIKMVCMKIRNTVLKIIVLNTDDILAKILITLYYILKTEILSEETNSINLLYTLSDLQTIINIKDIKILQKEFNKIRSAEISSKNYINITDIKSFIIEYKNCMNRISNIHHT